MNPTDFYELLKILVSIISSFFAAFFASSLALKNTKKEKYYEERKNLYCNLINILPTIDDFETQSDFLYMTNESGINAENTLILLKSTLNAERKSLEGNKEIYKNNKKYEIECRIHNLECKISRQKEYIAKRKELLSKIKKFEDEGNYTLLRIFASENVFKNYLAFNVNLHNEFYCNNGTTKEHILNNLINLITFIRKDLSGK